MFALARKIIKSAVSQYPDVKPYLSKDALKAIGGYQKIRDDYFVTVYDAVQGYLESSRPVTAYQNSFLSGMAEAFQDAVYMGYTDAGAEPPIDPDTQSWLSERIAFERGNIVSLFERLFILRRSDNFTTEKKISEANQRAEGYTATLDALYQEARMRGGKNKTLVFAGDDGQENCETCRRLKGKRHRISWIIENDMVPRKGNEKFICGGWNCHHFWYDPVTGERYVFEQ